METEALIRWESNDALQLRVKKMLEIQKYVMKEGIDYGIIPGCNKPSLFKPGSELLMVTFKISDKPVVDDLSKDDIIRYRVRNDMSSIETGTYLGYGLGECSSDEDKYRWRKSVCDEEWDDTEIDRRREKWFKPYKKSAYKVKQVRTSPADVANTILKMAKKRSKIDGVLSVLAASRIYTQDLEDMSKELQEMIAEEGGQKKESTKPDITQETTERQTPTQEETDSLKLISEKQGYFLIAKMKKCGVDEQSLLNYLKIPSVFYVTWDKKVNTCMDKLLKTIQDKPKFFDKYKAESEKKEEPTPDQKAPTVQGDEDFIKNLRTIAYAAGCKDDEAINKKLLVNFPKIESMDKIDVDSQGLVIDFFISLKDNPEQA